MLILLKLYWKCIFDSPTPYPSLCFLYHFSKHKILFMHKMQHVRLHVRKEMTFPAWSYGQRHKYLDYFQSYRPPDCTCWLCVSGWSCGSPAVSHILQQLSSQVPRDALKLSPGDQEVWGHSCPPAENQWGNDPLIRRRSWKEADSADGGEQLHFAVDMFTNSLILIWFIMRGFWTFSTWKSEVKVKYRAGVRGGSVP